MRTNNNLARNSRCNNIQLMASRKPFQLDAILFLWNAALAIFSLLGFVRMSPEWFWSLKE